MQGRLIHLSISQSRIENQHLHVCSRIGCYRRVSSNWSYANVSRRQGVHQACLSRHRRILRKPGSWQVIFLLEVPAASWLRPCKPRHSKNSRCSYHMKARVALPLSSLSNISNSGRSVSRQLRFLSKMVQVSQLVSQLASMAFYAERFCRLILSDNTNADAETRAIWINLAQKLDVSIRCVVFTASAKVCEHNDTYRALNIGPEVSLVVALLHNHRS